MIIQQVHSISSIKSLHLCFTSLHVQDILKGFRQPFPPRPFNAFLPIKFCTMNFVKYHNSNLVVRIRLMQRMPIFNSSEARCGFKESLKRLCMNFTSASMFETHSIFSIGSSVQLSLAFCFVITWTLERKNAPRKYSMFLFPVYLTSWEITMIDFSSRITDDLH